MHNEKVYYRESNMPQIVLRCQFLLDRQPLSFPDLNHRYPKRTSENRCITEILKRVVRGFKGCFLGHKNSNKNTY